MPNTATPSLDKVTPPQNFVDKTSHLVAATLKKEGWVLSCEDVELMVDEVANPDGLLPLVMWIAGQTVEKIWGPQELVFRCDSKALCGVVPDLVRSIAPPSIWMHAVHYELEQVALANPSGPVLIDDWFKRWNTALEQKKILLLPPRPAAPTQTRSG